MDSPISHETSLEAFFFARVEEIQSRRESPLSPEIEAYVVHMLTDFARRPAVAGRTSAPLALQYLSARERGTKALRAVGDRALYIAGAVPRSLDRTPVNVRYVRGIGEAAYRQVHENHPRLAVFAELADDFEALAELVGDAVEPEDQSPESLLDVYERWRSHGESRDARRLVEAGVLLDPDGSDQIQ
ncbi:MAG: hypothetical protein B7733_24535 [Myxococcales bacterium FL481]|nr:MAG: hypothetical protein B7733_24535 [Myxococcales bacterium FL481]